MPESAFGFLFDLARRKRRHLLVVVLLISALGLLGLTSVQLDSDVGLMIPKHPFIESNMDFFRKSNLSGKVVVSVGLEGPSSHGRAELFKAVDDLAAALKGLGPELITAVNSGVSEKDLAQEMDSLFQNLPGIMTAEDLQEVDALIDREAVSGRLRAARRELLKPGGIFFNSMVRSDPLGLRLMALGKLSALSSATGYDVGVEDGHYISADGEHSMLIAQTPIAVTDTAGAARLLSAMRGAIGGLPDYVQADIICGHNHTLSNEAVIKRDIGITLSIASVVFLVLFIVIIGDFGAVLIYLIPVLSVILAVDISYLLLGRLSYSVIGLGAVIAGIAVDYGIHVYIAARGADTGADDGRARAVRHVSRPVTYGALTTAGIFFAFFFSHIEGYHQMAVFSILSVIISLALAIMVLPHFLSSFGGLRRRVADSIEGRSLSGPLTVIIWALMTAVLAYYSLSLRFDSDIKAVDGTAREIIGAEERFEEVWGRRKLAMLVSETKGLEEALELNEAVYAEAVKAMGESNVSSVSSIMPSRKTREENLKRWTDFWSDGREARLRALLKEEGRKYGFSEQAFDPFFNGLYRETGDTDTGGLMGRFIYTGEGGYQALSFFPDEAPYLKAAKEIAGRHPGAYLVSGSMLSETVSEVITSDMRLMTVVAASFVVLLTVLFMRGIREALLALVPVVTSIIWLFGAVAAMGLSLNIANLVAYIVVMGLCVDYGIFMTYRSRRNEGTGTVLAVTLSAASTLAGAGALLFARHPALYSIGLTIVIGVGAGYIASIFAVPWLYGMVMGRQAGPSKDQDA